MTPSGIKPATLPLVAQCLNILPHVTNWEMSAERSTSSAFALLLSLDSKSVTIFVETRRIRVPEMCLPTFYTTHTPDFLRIFAKDLKSIMLICYVQIMNVFFGLIPY